MCWVFLLVASTILPTGGGAERGVATQDTELGVIARLPVVQAVRGGGGAAAEEAERGAAAQLTELCPQPALPPPR